MHGTVTLRKIIIDSACMLSGVPDISSEPKDEGVTSCHSPNCDQSIRRTRPSLSGMS
jgi:hypothetical protein